MSKTYVKDSTSVLKKVLLCPPTYFEFEPINVITEDWLEKGEKANKEACMREHAEFAQAYRENGVEVVMMDPNPNCTYEVFARDFGACLAEGYIMGNFRDPFWFLDEYTIAHGVIARTDWDGFENVRRQAHEHGYEMIGVPALRQNLHLDMCFNIVAEKVAVVCKEALPYNFLKMLEKRKFDLIDVPQEGVYRHYCNLQCLGDGRVLTFYNNKKVNEAMSARGIKPICVDLVEILKGGGGPHCMTFPLERDA